jgi:hypothetical protein
MIRAPAIVAVVFSFLTCILWVYPNPFEILSARSAILLVACFWTSIIAALLSIAFVRTQKSFTLISLLATAVLLTPPGLTAFTFTLWTVRGFAP